MPSKRILFVDDEARILEGLRRLLRGQRSEWDMTFANSGQEALARLAEHPFDVIVSDMRMPGMDGATLLTHVQRQFPGVVRIVLSGHTEVEATMRVLPVAHQFLTKPCDAAVLRETIGRACDLRALLQDSGLQKLVGELNGLPSLPRIYATLTRALAAADVSAKRIAEIVEQDMAMCAKFLQLANSAFFVLPHRVSNVASALNFLGVSVLKNVVLSIEAFRAFDDSGTAPFSLEAVQHHALLSAGIAHRLLPEKRQAEDAFTAAMLHDVGMLVLATRLPDRFARVVDAMRAGASSMTAVEAETGVSHAHVGAYLLGLWGLPTPIVEAVAHHHAPSRVAHERFDVLGAVHVANALAHEQAPGPPGCGEMPEPLDLAYLESLGVAGNVPRWRAIAAEQIQRANAA